MILSFIIVEYYSISEILNCCSSIDKSTDSELKYEIIVSSNSVYPDEYKAELLSRYGNLKWIFNEKNGGFAYAMNCGLEKAIGDIFIIMNPDVKIKEGVNDMLCFLQSHLDVGIIAPRIVDINGKVQDSFRTFITPWNFLYRHLLRFLGHESYIKVNDEIQEIDWVIGAFMATSRSAYEKVGGLDDRYFMYCEDMDWCKRMHLQGYSVVYYPQAVIEYEGTRSARHSWKYAWIFMKSLFRYWTKFLW
ncbi:glycosyltransferase family 2 protein [uncultured Bacteroides sp.]|uniref:glycosyltransferase family 2 protein n=1 Tax=uncultured Bacteroides sp. TaxID=162156 RepID=UPI00280B63BD|nr:glycosyltransferase family 2 protein [uncultured Bacteroides sp.]